jgi:hypothetical protein
MRLIASEEMRFSRLKTHAKRRDDARPTTPTGCCPRKLLAPVRTSIFGGIGSLLLAATLVLGDQATLVPSAGPVCSPTLSQGEFKADLAFLKRFYTAPLSSGESNHYLDLWAGQTLRDLVQSAGLTNNHTLFVNSHGEAVTQGTAPRYAFYPHESLVAAGQAAPHFSARDLAQLVGPEAACRIHNIVVAGCNAAGAFDPGELRKNFIHATNVTHCPAGQLGYQAMFHQALLVPSARVQPLHETVQKARGGQTQYFLGSKSGRHTRPLDPYVAELFLPGAGKPFRTQVAGRELLDPLPTPLALAREP